MHRHASNVIHVAPFAVLSVATEQPALRSWKSADGRFEVKARFVKAVGNVVTLRKPDGTNLTIPLEKLSQRDIDWLKGKKTDEPADVKQKPK